MIPLIRKAYIENAALQETTFGIFLRRDKKRPLFAGMAGFSVCIKTARNIEFILRSLIQSRGKPKSVPLRCKMCAEVIAVDLFTILWYDRSEVGNICPVNRDLRWNHGTSKESLEFSDKRNEYYS